MQPGAGRHTSARAPYEHTAGTPTEVHHARRGPAEAASMKPLSSPPKSTLTLTCTRSGTGTLAIIPTLTTTLTRVLNSTPHPRPHLHHRGPPFCPCTALALMHSLPTSPVSCISESTPSRMRTCTLPISLMNSSLRPSSMSSILVTRKSVPITSRPLYPSAHSSSTMLHAAWKSALTLKATAFLTSSGWGWSHTLKTFSELIRPKPACVACALLSAWRMSPSAVKMSASRPESLWGTPSASSTSSSRLSTCWSVSLEKRRMAQRLWMGSMTFSDRLHASAKRVVEEKSSIVRRIACCAPPVIESASSRTMILCLPGGSVTFFCANALILFLTTSMPRSSEALSSSTASLKASPSSERASARTLVVLPVPGGPDKMRLGMFPCDASASRRPTVSALPTTSFIVTGRYFSSHGCSKLMTIQLA
mmetsp:Transcript_41537/g.88623  ORF Transcript_41537/g.88623 Transcript_41537/m.88623 type:complete len:421 (+) Transcript_41537:139-1401(+)